MTLLTTDDRVSYQGNGVAFVFPYAFKIFTPADLVVTTTDADGVVTTLLLNTDYIVGNAGSDEGGDVTLLVPPIPTGTRIDMVRTLEATQELDIRNQARLYPEELEDALDKLTALIQGLAVNDGNALHLTSDGLTWNGEGLRIVSLADGLGAQDGVTVGQLETAVANLASGAGAFSPRVWNYTSSGGNVYSLPGGTLTRPESYFVSVDGLEQRTDTYTIGTSSDPFVLVLDALPPVGADIAIRALAFTEALSSANIDTGNVVSGVFVPSRLGIGAASDAVFLAGGPGQPTWTNELNGPLTVTTLNFTTLNGFADASLINSGIFPPPRLGSGVPTVNTFLCGDGTWKAVTAAPTGTQIHISDPDTPDDLYTALELTGTQAEFQTNILGLVKLFLDETSGSGTAVLQGYFANDLPPQVIAADGLSVLGVPGDVADVAQSMVASTNHHVMRRLSNTIGFGTINILGIDATGTPDNTKYLRGDGTWSTVTASLGSSVQTDPNGNTPAFNSNQVFYRGDGLWANTIRGDFFVQAASGATPATLQIGSSLAGITFSAGAGVTPAAIRFNTGLTAASSSGNYLTNNDDDDRLMVNGRARIARVRGEGAGMVRIQATAGSGTVNLDINTYGHFMTTPTGSVTYTFSDSATDPTTNLYATEFTVELFAPGGNVITWPGSVVWGGGLAPTLSAAGVNILKFTRRQGVANYIGALIVGGASGAYSNEDAQDAVGGILVDTSTIDFTYSDATPSIAASIKPLSIDSTMIANNGIQTANLDNGIVTSAKIAAATIALDRLSATGLRDSTTFLSGDNTWKTVSSGSSGQAAIQFRDESNTVGGLGTIQTINFTGSGVTATAVGTTMTVGIPGGSTIFYEDNGFAVADSSTRPTINFGANLTVSLGAGNRIVVDATGGGGGGGQAPIQLQDEGVSVGAVGAITSMNFVGAGVTASVVGTAATITVPGGGGGGSTAFFNVRDYGALGNGSADDTAGIQAAINATAAAGGGIMFMPAGTYMTNGGITCPGKVHIMGAGMSTTTIKLRNAAPFTGDILRGTGQYIEFSDFTIDGNSAGNPSGSVDKAGLSFGNNSRYCTVRNVTVYSNRGFGIAFNICNDMLFENCFCVENKKKQGIWMGALGGTSSRLKFYNCSCIDNDWDGMHVGAYDVQVIGGHYNGNGRDVSDIGTFGACGIYMDPIQAPTDRNLIIDSVHAIGNLESGISMYGEGIIVSNCISRGNWAAGIVVGGSRVIVSNCYCEGNGLVFFNGPPFWTDPANTFRFIYSGISSNGGQEVIMTGNRCHDLKSNKSQKWGITAQPAGGGIPATNFLRMTGNMLHGNRTADSDTATATNVTIL